VRGVGVARPPSERNFYANENKTQNCFFSP